MGSKLLAAEVKVASSILSRVTAGHSLTRRERMQLMRTTMDMFRLIPLVIVVIVPFMELALPVLLKLFPNMLPSTFENKSTKEEKIKLELQTRLAIAEFFQDTVQSMAIKYKDGNASAAAGGGGGAIKAMDGGSAQEVSVYISSFMCLYIMCGGSPIHLHINSRI